MTFSPLLLLPKHSFFKWKSICARLHLLLQYAAFPLQLGQSLNFLNLVSSFLQSGLEQSRL